MKNILLISLLLTATLFSGFKRGENCPDIVLKDQFGKVLKVEASDRLIFVTFEKETAIKTADFFKKKPKGFLKKAHIKYLSDISTMPSFITSMFALPKMRKYPFSVMLIRDDLGNELDKKEGKVTVYRIRHQKIASIEFVDPEQLSSVLQ